MSRYAKIRERAFRVMSALDDDDDELYSKTSVSALLSALVHVVQESTNVSRLDAIILLAGVFKKMSEAEVESESAEEASQ